MTSLRVLLSRLLDVVLGRGRDERLAHEIQSHLDLLTDEYLARGMSPAEARAAARRAFGGVDQMKADYRDQRGLPFLDALTQDVRFGARLLARDRGFTITAVLVLGLGIGINNMLFTILNAHTIRGLPIEQGDRVLFVSMLDTRGADRGFSYRDYEALRNAATSLEGLAAFTSSPAAVAGDGRVAERFESAFVSGNALAVIRTQPILGRAFAAEDDRPGAAAVAILGSGVWHSRYGGDPKILGRSILVNGVPMTIVGVMSDRSGFPSTAQVWLPLAQAPGLAVQNRDAPTLRLFARVRDGVTVAAARAEIETIVDGFLRERPDANKNLRARVVPINERFLGRLSDPAWLAFMTAGFLVVVISCANVANLMLARSVHRTREIAIRTSLGASRSRVVRQLLVEGGVLATLGGTIGLGVAVLGTRLFRSAIPDNVLPYWVDYSVDARVIAALIAVSVVTIFVFALLPAVHASKTDVNRVLKDGGRTGPAHDGAQRWSTVFLTAEFALAVVLLAQFSVSLRSNGPSVQSDLAVDTKEVLTAALTLPPEAYRTPEQRADFYRRLSERLRSRSDISSMSVADVLPQSGGREEHLQIAGRPQSGEQPTVVTVAVAPRYFATFGLTLTRGRDFVDEDGAPGRAHTIVNDRVAQLFFGNEDPVGHLIAVDPPSGSTRPEWLTIVGVAPSVRQRRGDAEPVVYLPYRSTAPATASILVRSHTETDSVAALLKGEVQALDNNLPLYRVRTMAQAIRDLRWNGRVAHLLILSLTCIAVALATVGLYAVTAHAVSQRTQEIGVRMALGARPLQVVRLIMRRAIVQLAFGFGAGIAGSAVWDWTFSSGIAGVTAQDPRALTIVLAILGAVGLIACLVPARRAIRLDPVSAIRRE